MAVSLNFTGSPIHPPSRCSQYPPFEVAEEDVDEGALRCAAGQSSGRDLVEEFVAYGVWPLVHGWALGEVCPR